MGLRPALPPGARTALSLRVPLSLRPPPLLLPAAPGWAHLGTGSASQLKGFGCASCSAVALFEDRGPGPAPTAATEGPPLRPSVHASPLAPQAMPPVSPFARTDSMTADPGWPWMEPLR